MGMKDAETTPILQDAQSRLLRATLALYRAQEDAADAAAEVSRAAGKSLREVIVARFALITADRKLREAEEKRKAVIARIRRSDFEARGERWLRVAGGRSAA
jgi:hypothetical protein